MRELAQLTRPTGRPLLSASPPAGRGSGGSASTPNNDGHTAELGWLAVHAVPTLVHLFNHGTLQVRSGSQLSKP
jgi:hypothetical protein